MDSFFKQRFNAAKCKTLLKLTIPRIKLLRNRREIQLKQMRRDIAKLLETGQEATARIRVEHIIREEKMMAAQEILELFSELISVRLPIIDAQRECPLDLKEAISSICFAAPRCADLPELLQVQMLFTGKYGKEFVSAATELLPECGVNRQLVELLSIRAPAPDVKLKLLKEIAEEHELDWDPRASENELLKPHEDLLNGPMRFVSGSKLPLPEEKQEDKMHNSEPSSQQQENSDSEDFDIIEFPEVPKQLLQTNKGTVLAPEMLPFPASALSEDDYQQEANLSGVNECVRDLESSDVLQEKPVSKEVGQSKLSATSVEDKQFLPFISPPSRSPVSFPEREENTPPSISKTKNDDVDFQDVLAAAQAAAESAERAAAAARSAASIAQLRISELVKKNSEVSGSTVHNTFHVCKANADEVDKGETGQHKSFGDSVCSANSSSEPNGFENYKTDQPINCSLHEGCGPRQPQRLPSMDDETYFSYPNLFTSQGSNHSPLESFKELK